MIAFRHLLLASAVAIVPSNANAEPILIINGLSTSAVPTLTSDATAQLSMLQQAAGNTVSITDSIPSDISGFQQVWDIRFSNSAALTAQDRSFYVSYLQAGGGMFVIGENFQFQQRSNSVRQFIEDAGGGSLPSNNTLSEQFILSPFDMPDAVSTVTFLGAGGVANAGNGQFIATREGGASGVGVAFGEGDLTNAPMGELTAIFDANFLTDDSGPDGKVFTSNLIDFLSDPIAPPPPPPPPGPPSPPPPGPPSPPPPGPPSPPPPGPPTPPPPGPPTPPPTEVPEPGTLALIGTGLVGLGLARRRKSAK